MKKSLHITIQGLDQPKVFLEALKIRLGKTSAEGVACAVSVDTVEIEIVGDKDSVDDVLGILDTAVFFEQKRSSTHIQVKAEPLVPQDNYRGVLRFVMPH